MNDIVYVVRDGENPELRYSLRSLANVEYGRVWIIGGSPPWTQPDGAYIPNPNTGSSYAATRSHLRLACQTEEISDPFWLWHDDYFAMRPTTLTPRHRGSLQGMAERFARTGTIWARGLREVAAWLEKRYQDPICWDIHAPLLVHKALMLEALELAKTFKADSVPVYTLYGNVYGFDGVETPDPKMMRRSDPFPTGDWLSSSDSTFRSVVEPVLRYTFPDPSPYERY